MSLLNLAWTWNDYFKDYAQIQGESYYGVLQQVFNILSIVLWVALGIVGAVGGIYAIYLGIQLARADEQGKRDDAKKHLITVFIAMGVTVLLILAFNTFVPALISAFNSKDALKLPDSKDGKGGILKPLLSLIRA